ncbi:MAG: DUF5990 family protein [Pyrinomonadaceae bacterium]
MERELTIRIVVENPPAGVDFGLQKGRGNDYETIQKQRSTEDFHFEFTVRVKQGKDATPTFLGLFTQGPPHQRFVYLDIGTYAGQVDTQWSRRLKIPLTGITWQMADKATNSSSALETRIQGTGKDGGPSCGSVKLLDWKLSG